MGLIKEANIKTKTDIKHVKEDMRTLDFMNIKHQRLPAYGAIPISVGVSPL